VNLSGTIRGIGGTLLLSLVLSPLCLGSAGCSGACANAKDLCEQCELAVDTCDRFDDYSSDQCQAAVDAYEASCAL
jgi:hypothetical protein